MIEVSKTKLVSMTEEEAADWYKKQQINVIKHLGNYWKETRIGFYEPIHLLANLKAEEAECPKKLYWGFRASLCETDAGLANSTIGVHILSESQLKNYDLNKLPQKSRSNIRKSRKLIQFVKLLTPKLLEDQGYEVFCSAATRIGAKMISKNRYLQETKKYFANENQLIIAGLIDGKKLGGYIQGYAINGIVYLDNTYIATEALSTCIGSGLRYEFIQVGRRSSEIRQFVSGLYIPSNQSLVSFKEKMGFHVQEIPLKTQINPIVHKFLQYRYRNTDLLYLITGKQINK